MESFHLVFLRYSEKERELGDPTGSQRRERGCIGPRTMWCIFILSASSLHTLGWQKTQVSTRPPFVCGCDPLSVPFTRPPFVCECDPFSVPSTRPLQWWRKDPRALWWPGEASRGCHYSGLHTSPQWGRSLHTLLFLPSFPTTSASDGPHLCAPGSPYTNPCMSPAGGPCSASHAVHSALSALSPFCRPLLVFLRE